MTDRPGFNPQDWRVHPPARAPAYKTSNLRSPNQPLHPIDPNVVGIAGPVFGHADIGPNDFDLLQNYARPDQSPIGERIILHGKVMDQDARPVPATLVEIWQANAGGRYRHHNDGYLAALDPNFGGCGRVMTDADGSYRFLTVKPGAYPWPNSDNSWRPAHVHVSVFGAGFAQRLITQCYFEGDPLIPLCPIAQSIPDQGAVDRLCARLDMQATVPFDAIAYRFDIVLRGRNSTLFENRLEGN